MTGGEGVKADLAKFVEYIDNEFWIRDGSYGIQDEYFGSTAGMIEDFIPKNEEVKENV